MNLRDEFVKSAQKFPSRVIIQERREDAYQKFTYEEIRRQIESLAYWLQSQGINQKDRVGIIAKNGCEWPVIFFATQFIDAVSVPLNPDSTEREIENILADSGCKIIFVETESSLLKNNRHKAVCVDSTDFRKILITTGKAVLPEINPEGLACLLYTSGTTAEPKGVMLTHKNLYANFSSLASLCIFTKRDSVLAILPFYHAYSLMTTLIVPLLFAVKIVIPASMRGEALLEAMAEAHPTIFIGVPEIFHLFHQRIISGIDKTPALLRLIFEASLGSCNFIRKIVKLNLARALLFRLHSKFGGRMRLFVSGGAKLDKKVASDLFRFGFTIVEGYGLTETAPVLTFNPINKPKLGSVGKSIPDVEIKIVEKNQEGVGEVIVRGPNVMKGYYNKEKQTEEVIKDGWLYTGDLGYLDKDDYLFLTGRSKEVIVLSSGKNIYPEEIEALYGKSDYIKELCVLETQASQGSEEKLLYAVVVPNTEQFTKWGEINLRRVIQSQLENVSIQLPSFQRVRGFAISHQPLPRTTLGKVKRYKVAQDFAGSILEQKQMPKTAEVSGEDKEILGRKLTRDIILLLKKITKTSRAINLDDGLEVDLGVDSLLRLEIISGLEKSLGVKIPDEFGADIFTVRELILRTEQFLLQKDRGAQPDYLGHEFWKENLKIEPDAETLKKIDLKGSFFSRIFISIIGVIFYSFFKVFHHLKIEGQDNLPLKGPYILCVNHESYYDGFIISAAVPNRYRKDFFVIGYAAYFEVPLIRNLIKAGHVIPINFSKYITKALRSTAYVLRQGKNVCIFPEAERTIDGKLQAFKKGIGVLIKELSVPVVPAIIEGSFETWPRIRTFPKAFVPIKIKFGRIVCAEKLTEAAKGFSASDEYEAIALAVKAEMAKLKDEHIS